jgi:hypothetical protein
MPVYEGRISGSVATVAFHLPCKIISGYLANKTGGAINFSVNVVTGTGSRTVINTTQLSGAVYIIDTPVILLKGYYLIIVSSSTLDYYFSIEDI